MLLLELIRHGQPEVAGFFIQEESMPGTNTIDLYDKETDKITPLRLYRIMTIGHLEKPEEDEEKARKYWMPEAV